MLGFLLFSWGLDAGAATPRSSGALAFQEVDGLAAEDVEVIAVVEDVGLHEVLGER